METPTSIPVDQYTLVEGITMNINTKRILIALLFCLFSFSVPASDLCDGFIQGYISGYKKAHNSNITPLVPLCPLESLKGFGDSQSDNEMGYILGFNQGQADANETTIDNKHYEKENTSTIMLPNY